MEEAAHLTLLHTDVFAITLRLPIVAVRSMFVALNLFSQSSSSPHKVLLLYYITTKRMLLLYAVLYTQSKKREETM